LVVDHDLNLSVLHDADTRVGRAQIDTDDGAGDRVGVLLDGLLVLGHGRLGQHQRAEEDDEEVHGDGPCRALARGPRAACHCVCRESSRRLRGRGCREGGSDTLGELAVRGAGFSKAPGITREMPK
jgi:hypothetical protein